MLSRLDRSSIVSSKSRECWLLSPRMRMLFLVPVGPPESRCAFNVAYSCTHFYWFIDIFTLFNLELSVCERAQHAISTVPVHFDSEHLERGHFTMS